MSRSLRVLAASSAASVADLTVLATLVGLSLLAPGPAAALACVAGGLVGYHASRRWVFDAPASAASGLAYGTFVVGGSALWSGALVHVAVTAGAAVPAAKLGAACLVWGGWNIPVTRAVFTRTQPKEPQS